MTKEYSAEFRELISDEKKIGELIQESGVGSGTEGVLPKFEDWERQRRFIAGAINKDGTILDVGCASGLLLKCLLEWSDYRVTPYGFDNNPKRIQLAKQLLPEHATNIVEADVKNLDLAAKGLPKTYDFVYWNVWEDFVFQEGSRLDAFNSILECVRTDGRLIMGFYPNNKEEKERDLKKLDRLKKLNVSNFVFKENAQSDNIFLVYWDKNESNNSFENE